MWAKPVVLCNGRATRPQFRTLPGLSGRRELPLHKFQNVQLQRVSSIPGDGKEQPSSNGSVSVDSVEAVVASVSSTPAAAPAAAESVTATAAPTPAAGELPSEEAPAAQKAAEETEASAAVEAAAASADEETPATSAAPETTAAESHPLDVQDTLDEKADVFATKELLTELADTSKLGRRGEGWFVAQLLVFAMVIFPPMKLHGLVDLLSILAISAGIVFIAYAMSSIGRSLSPVPQPRAKGKLITTGMYSYVRHPMYAGLLLLSFGLTFLTGSETRFALSFILWWVLEQKANLEEKLLAEVYPEYAEYKRRVHKFFPYLY